MEYPGRTVVARQGEHQCQPEPEGRSAQPAACQCKCREGPGQLPGDNQQDGRLANAEHLGKQAVGTAEQAVVIL